MPLMQVPAYLEGWIAPTIVLALIFLAFRVGKWVEAVNKDRKTLLDAADKDRKRFREIVAEIREDIKKIFRRLPVQEITGASPLRLTDFGRALSDGIAGAEWATRIADAVAPQITGMEAYDIQEFSFAYVENDLAPSDDERKAMRRTAYEQGARMEQIRRVLAIELRDKLLELAGLGAPN